MVGVEGERRPRVLVVEEDGDTRDLITGLLRDELGAETMLAPDDATARLAIAAAPPDLLLLDVTLPDGDGFALAGELKADAGTRDIRIIAMTARFRSEEATAQARAARC